jgi:hypothetical protein
MTMPCQAEMHVLALLLPETTFIALRESATGTEEKGKAVDLMLR